MITEDQVLKALDKPRTLYSVLQVVNPSGFAGGVAGVAHAHARCRQGQVRHQQGTMVESMTVYVHAKHTSIWFAEER
jgi:hypothetical protein